MATKPPICWDWIETQWQRGTLSNVQIALLHKEEFGREVGESAIRYRASQYGWQRDVAETVRRQARAKLAKEELRETANNTANSQNLVATPEEAIEAEEAALIDLASDALVIIEKRQRTRISQCQAVAGQLLVYASRKLRLDEDGLPIEDYEPGELRDVAAVVKTAIDTNATVIALERKSFGMDDPKNALGDLDETSSRDSLKRKIDSLSSRLG